MALRITAYLIGAVNRHPSSTVPGRDRPRAVDPLGSTRRYPDHPSARPENGPYP
ncbi:MAG: hypothetical protein VKI82_01330 [Leptolyngbya sp.]|nr:hypothetical protein [Leptolyngbya sp.]